MASIVHEIVRSIADEDAHLEAVNTTPAKDALLQLAGRLMLMAVENPEMTKPDELGDTPLEKAFIVAGRKILLAPLVEEAATAYKRGVAEGKRKVGRA